MLLSTQVSCCVRGTLGHSHILFSVPSWADDALRGSMREKDVFSITLSNIHGWPRVKQGTENRHLGLPCKWQGARGCLLLPLHVCALTGSWIRSRVGVLGDGLTTVHVPCALILTMGVADFRSCELTKIFCVSPLNSFSSRFLPHYWPVLSSSCLEDPYWAHFPPTAF